MKVVIDAHGLLLSIPQNGGKRWLYDAYMNKKFTWVISNEILPEYAEMVDLTFGQVAMELVVSILLTASNTIRFEPSFKWQLVKQDPDDNKFVDCGIGANVDFIVTDDKHIRSLSKIKDLFPPVPIITFDEFKLILSKQDG